MASLDGGGSKTAAAIAFKDGRVIRTELRGGSNPQDNPGWQTELGGALQPLRGAERLVLGLAGFGEVPDIDRAMTALAQDIIGPQTQIMNDVALAARAAFPEGGGVLLLSGTGSMAMATGPLGTVRAGGWGDLFSDEGSAFWIGRTALARASHERDGIAPDRGLASALEDALALGRGGFALLGWALGQPHPRSAIASLAQVLDGLAGQGLAPARDLMQEAAGELTALARTAARRAGLAGPGPWAASGSVFRSRILREAVSAELGSDPVPPAAPTLAGGLMIAARAAGWQITPEWRARVTAAF